MDFVDLSELRNLVENLVTSAQQLQEAIIKNYIRSHLRDIIAKYYDIGELVHVKKLDKGYVNESYAIETEKNGKRQKYFLRKYKRGIREEEVKFEHSIIKHLMKKGFDIAASIIMRRDGKSYVKEIKSVDDEDEEIYFAVFEFLKGEDKYTWDNPVCTMEELRDSARVLARYHSTVSDLKYEGRRYEPKIIDMLPTISGNLMKYAKRAGTTKFDAYFLKNLDSILSVVDETIKQVDRDDYKKLIQLAIHCDYHPGNLKFENEKVVGLFDFDWSKIDVRIFDVALAMVYFCTTWEGKEDGDFILEKVYNFLQAYQEQSIKCSEIGPLTNVELYYLPIITKAANLYVLNWDVDDYYIKKQNPYEYLIYLQHNVRAMRWLENNWESFINTLKSANDSVIQLSK